MASINFVTAHDGFTLRDLVSYNEKHNDANGEDNNDGESHNRSWNHGVEGPTDDPEIQAERAKAQRNFLATLLLSQGVPMILHGDELGRTQDGNNNTYAQDSEISWVHWDEADKPLVEFTAAVAKLRHAAPDVPAHAASSPATPSAPATASGSTTSSGCTSTAARWSRTTGRAATQALGMYLNGDGIAGKDARGRRHHRRPLPALLQRRRRRAGDPAAGGVRPGLGRRHRHQRRGRHHDHARRRVDVRARQPQRRRPPGARRRLEAEPDHSVAASVAALTQTTSTPAADQRSGARPTEDPDA